MQRRFGTSLARSKGGSTSLGMCSAPNTSVVNSCDHRSSNKMPAGVRAAVREAVVKYGGKSEEDAADYVAAMEREGRLIEDCWS